MLALRTLQWRPRHGAASAEPSARSSARTREFGVRLAVGSSPRYLLTHVLSDGVQIAAIAIAAGAGGGYAITLVAAVAWTPSSCPDRLPVVGPAQTLDVPASSD